MSDIVLLIGYIIVGYSFGYNTFKFRLSLKRNKITRILEFHRTTIYDNIEPVLEDIFNCISRWEDKSEISEGE